MMLGPYSISESPVGLYSDILRRDAETRLYTFGMALVPGKLLGGELNSERV